jgi:hypothetical protein
VLPRIALLSLFAVAFGCQNVPAARLPTVEVAAPGATVEAVAPPETSATAEPGKPRLTAKARAAKQALAACHIDWLRRPLLSCDLDPNCWGPRDPPKTLKEKECNQLLWMDFGGSSDPGASEPCVLLRSAAFKDEVIAANDKAGAGALTIPEVAASAADNRTALVEHSSAQKDLADAMAQGDTSRIAADHVRIRRAILLQEEAVKRHAKACFD